MSADATTEPPRHAPIALWRAAGALLATLHMLFGAPEELAARHTLLRETHALIASWLRCAEAMLRRLLLIEASAHAAAPLKPMPACAARPRVRRLLGFDADKPEAWRVSFQHLTASNRRGMSAAARGRTRGEARRFCSAWPLAERYEALIRVFNAPAAFARRLARRLHAKPQRLHDLLAAPPEAEHRIEDFALLGDHAAAAWRPYFSSA